MAVGMAAGMGANNHPATPQMGPVGTALQPRHQLGLQQAGQVRRKASSSSKTATRKEVQQPELQILSPQNRRVACMMLRLAAGGLETPWLSFCRDSWAGPRRPCQAAGSPAGGCCHCLAAGWHQPLPAAAGMQPPASTGPAASGECSTWLTDPRSRQGLLQSRCASDLNIQAAVALCCLSLLQVDVISSFALPTVAGGVCVELSHFCRL